MFNDNGTCINLQHRDNHKVRVFYQNFGRSTIVIYHTHYFSERRISKMLALESDHYSNQTHNVRAFYGKINPTKDESNLDLYQLYSKIKSSKYPNATFEGSLLTLSSHSIKGLYHSFREWRAQPKINEKFSFFNKWYTKEYDSMQVEFSEYSTGNDHMVLLYAYDCPESMNKIN